MAFDDGGRNVEGIRRAGKGKVVVGVPQEDLKTHLALVKVC